MEEGRRESGMVKTAVLLTAEDVSKLPSDLRCELIDGVLIEMSPTNPEHGQTENTMAFRLTAHVQPGRLGRVYTGEVGFVLRRNPDTVRAPDVAFIRASRVPREWPRGFSEIMPDLVVEVASPSDSRTEIQGKIRDWIEAGVRLVWYLYPADRTVDVIRSLTDRETLTSEDTLEGGEVLPGFSCRVAEIFE